MMNLIVKNIKFFLAVVSVVSSVSSLQAMQPMQPDVDSYQQHVQKILSMVQQTQTRRQAWSKVNQLMVLFKMRMEDAKAILQFISPEELELEVNKSASDTLCVCAIYLNLLAEPCVWNQIVQICNSKPSIEGECPISEVAKPEPTFN